MDYLEQAVSNGVLDALLKFAQIISKNAADASVIVADTKILKTSSDDLAAAVQSQQPPQTQEGK